MKGDDYAFRFGGIERLYGRRALEHFRHAHYCHCRVGRRRVSWAAEALARSGVGTIDV